MLHDVRTQARQQVIAAIVAEGRRQLAIDGAAALSLRAVARELGMVSSAIYRYVANRDELLTLLIVGAYDSLGACVEADVASSKRGAPLTRWLSAACTIRTWALAHPHEYALVYGSPVPGYEAPEITIPAATRSTLALTSVVSDAHREGLLTTSERRPGRPPITDTGLIADFDTLRSAIDMTVDDGTVLDALVAWSQLFGLVSFELFGQTANVITHHEALFVAATRRVATTLGLTE